MSAEARAEAIHLMDLSLGQIHADCGCWPHATSLPAEASAVAERVAAILRLTDDPR